MDISAENVSLESDAVDDMTEEERDEMDRLGILDKSVVAGQRSKRISKRKLNEEDLLAERERAVSGKSHRPSVGSSEEHDHPELVGLESLAAEPDMETAISHYWKVSNMQVTGEWMQHFVARASFNLG